MAAKKLMNAHEALEYLENINVPSEDDLSDDEYFISSSDKSSSWRYIVGEERLFHLQNMRVIEALMKFRIWK